MYYIITKEQFLPVVMSQGAQYSKSAKCDAGQMQLNAVIALASIKTKHQHTVPSAFPRLC
jgi:hypothetical protein